MAVRRAAVIAAQDPVRPQFHFRAPGQWMDDPNGIVYHDGVYHVMYSLNPHSSEHRAGMVYRTVERVWDPGSPDWTGGITVWGHATSLDLVHWEHQPIALYPAVDRGEQFIWFGSTAINDEGVPVAIYTAVGPQMRPEDTAQQWGAVATSDLGTWEPMPTNPLLVAGSHRGVDVREWRDPFIFRADGRVFMILGARMGPKDGDDPVILLYQAMDRDLARWDYKGVLYRHPDTNVPSLECPNLVEVDGRWVLIFSPHGRVEYHVGVLDLASPAFLTEHSGIVDHSDNYYATNIMFGPEGRPILWAAIEGFEGTQGWNGALSLPRDLWLEGDRLCQRPVSALKRIRGATHLAEGALGDGLEVGPFQSGTAELVVSSANRNAEWEVWISAAEVEVGIKIERGVLRVVTPSDELAAFPLSRTWPDRLQVHVDRSVLDIAVDDTDCATLIVPAVLGPARVVLQGEQSGWVLAQLWQLDADDLFSGTV